MKDVNLWIVDDKVVFHTDLQAASQLDGLSRKPDKIITVSQWDAAEGLVRIIDGHIFIGKTDEEQNNEIELLNLQHEEKELQKELDDKDYKVIQASERGFILADVSPELHSRREYCRTRINEIRSRKNELQ